MTYETIPSFSNLDYKADIRDKVFKPLISQHNEHSVALEALNPLPAYAEELKELAHDTPKIRNLVAHGDEIIDLALQSKDIMQLANEAGIISGLDGRVTALEIRRLNESYLQEEGSGGDGSADLTELTNRVDSAEQAIDSLKPRLSRAESDISTLESKVESLELGGGSGEGGSVDLSPVLEKISSLEDEDVAINAEVSKLKTRMTNAEGSISDLENAPPSSGGSGPSEPTKWYVLPLGGQSNCVGYGETPYDINGFDAPNPRIKQVGRYATTTGSTISELTVNETKCNYGSLFDKLRPSNDCNLEIIPATPCLDHIQNMFQHNRQNGGTVSSGMYIARALLPHIPEDYGILLVPCAFGGTGFTSGANGTWNQAKLRAENPRRHGADTPMGKDFFYRTKYALELNEENVLLPFIWVQGENDKDAHKAHYDGFKAFFDWFKDLFEAENLQRFLPEKRMDNFRFFCVGPTKWWVGANTETDYVKLKNKDWEQFGEQDVFDRVSSYSNYVYLSNLYPTKTGKQLYFVRADIDQDGKFVETNRENGTGDTTSNRQIHLSTRGYSYNQADTIANAIFRYSGMFPGAGKMSTRPVWGGLGTVTTDNVVNLQHVGSDYSRLNEGLTIHQDFSSGSMNTNLVSGSSSTIGVGTAVTQVSDPNFGKVANFPGNTNNSWMEYTINAGNVSCTRVLTFKRDMSLQSADLGWFLAYPTSEAGGVVAFIKNGILATVDYRGSNRGSSLMAHAALECNWNGGYDGWQHLAIVYSKESKKVMLFLNGNLVQSSDINSAPEFQGAVVGNIKGSTSSNLFKGKIANTRMYTRALSHEEIRALADVDLLSKI